MRNLRKIAVLGAGVMGHGIAQIAAMSGYDVSMRDISQEILDRALENIRRSLDKLVSKGRLSREDAEETLSRIRPTLSLREAVEDADFVIEAVPEDLELKRRIFREVEEVTSKQPVLASNTSSLSITEIAEALDRPEKVVGMHFFNPPVIMRLVEVIPGEKTSKETVELAMDLARRLGKTPVLVRKDSPGFIVNRVLIPYLNEAAKMLDRGEAGVLEIDSAMQFKAGFPIGPFLLSDLIGIDILYHILEVFKEKLGPFYRPADSIQRLYREGKLGRKTGEGFYSYRGGQPNIPEEAGRGFDEVRLIAIMVNEATKLVSDGVAETADVDTAMKLGANLPEGPFEVARRIGVKKLVEVLNEMRERYGEGYAPSKLLLTLT